MSERPEGQERGARSDIPLVRVERRDDGVAVVTLDNPKVNALSAEVLGQLEAAAVDLTDAPPGAVVVTGGDRIFAAGADISEFGGPAEARQVSRNFRRALDALAAVPRCVIAAISGFALGGGCELALACDLRIASERAKLGQPEILLGIIPGGGGTQRLARLVGPAKAKDIILTGRQVGADEALRIGLVDEVVAPDELHDRALARAAELARGAVVAQGLAKRAIDQGLERPLDDGLALEQQLFADVFDTEDARIGIASFLEHGPGQADFVGR
ncbi:MAG TPA: enoyl-CoA hydratase-related protein [Acidimicrobiales bacterium]|jgi:enoyl-CoA hydratase|nr:enoyl-CoA hydratase-related protein [Acidimicrobiales bacterium]